MKGAQKPKRMGRKPPQKSLKQRRREKREAAHHPQPLDV